MLIAGWSLTKMCNLRCIHCYSASGKQADDELMTKEALAVVRRLKDADVAAVNFGGGECALRPDFIDICESLHENGIKISYTTNGTTLRRIEDHLDLFNDIGVSIDFADRRHDDFRGCNGTFERAVSTIENLVHSGVDTEIVTCLTKLNCRDEELEKILQLGKETGAKYLRVNRFRANGRGKENSYLAMSKDDLKEAYSFLADYMGQSDATAVTDDVSVPEPIFRSAFGGNYSIDGDPSGRSAFRIQADGEVTPSVFLSISGGNIKERGIRDIMGSDVFKRIREREPQGKCIDCTSYGHCRGGDAGASYLAYGHFNGPDPLCWIEPYEARVQPKKIQPKNWNVHELYMCTLYVPIRN